jgi:hypothetical protein
MKLRKLLHMIASCFSKKRRPPVVAIPPVAPHGEFWKTGTGKYEAPEFYRMLDRPQGKCKKPHLRIVGGTEHKEKV